jgi:hypothetical protein
MLTIKTLSPKQLFKDGVNLETGGYNYCVYVDSEEDTVARVLDRNSEWETQKGHRLKVHMLPHEEIVIDDSDTTSSEKKYIYVCKEPGGYLIGIYLC